ncbi:E3 ubiquitin-protein ligase MIEL1-like [Asparagus officinalis]|uniref:E3 ubiquitin-protein ligase MIEL1-like n=1 Tax=Asparagus officinalis TaxID=4686 RepID=UPI00098E0557|nr:E3 ubiquitin-protein ligase MIEL1-like [Asparagus officinalis]
MEVKSMPSSVQEKSSVDLGNDQFGCAHYKRRCRIRAPCCNEIFYCRHCHNEAKNCLDVDQVERHEIPRHDVKKVICTLCDTEQNVRQNCSIVGMGKYFCEKCNFFDDDVSKNQYHCDGCGICRTGGKENFFHCDRCGCCYSQILKDSHQCVERAMHHNCPICFEFLFDSTRDISVLPCGHTIHLECLREMEQHFLLSCPLCSKSICDMSSVWEKLDKEVASTPMPVMYRNKMVWILCNDCGTESNVHFHTVAHKCPGCSSYNTRQIRGVSAACVRNLRD